MPYKNPEDARACVLRNREATYARLRDKYRQNPEAYKARSLAYYRSHPEECAARRKAYRLAHLEECKAWHRANNIRNREKIAAKQKLWRDSLSEDQKRIQFLRRQAWRAANKAKIRKRQTAWRVANIERLKGKRKALYEAEREAAIAASVDWSRSHPGRRSAYARNRQAAKKQCPQGKIAEVAQFYEWVHTTPSLRCFWCMEIVPRSKRTVDHVTPIAQHGSHSLDNLVPSCFSCNCRKGKKSVETFLRETARVVRLRQVTDTRQNCG